MENSFDKTATETIDLLEARLRRIEFVLSGKDGSSTTTSDVNTTSAVQRLADLEHSLHQLASKSRVAQDILTLHSRYPDLFQSIDSKDVPTTLETSSILSIILSSASSYPFTASRLTSILDVPIPPPELSTQIIDLVPRIAKLEALQATQNADISELRQRSAAVIQKWYTVDILRAGDQWAELEGKVEDVEQKIRRAALAKRLDDDMV